MESTPPSIQCPVCGRAAGHFRCAELVLESWPRCDLVGSSDGELFASERLLEELERAGAAGYSHWPATIGFDEEFLELSPGVEARRGELPTYRYLAITGRCDGPWLHDIPGEPCPGCGQTRAITADPEGETHRSLELHRARARTTKLAYADSWRGEDFFWLPEPGEPIITERVAEILCRMGNLRKEEVPDRDRIRRLMPKWAKELEQVGWEVPVCVELGPADWVTR